MIHCWLKFRAHVWTDRMHGICSGEDIWGKPIKPYFVKYCCCCGACKHKDAS